MKTVDGEKRGDHQNVARAALVIETLAGAKERGMRLTDVVDATGLGTATIHRLLSGLVAHGFIDHDRNNSRYFVGLRMVGWAAAATQRYGLAPFVDAGLESLCAQTGDTVYFSLLSGLDSVCVDRREGSYPIRTLTLSVGDRRPLGIGAGSLALLAFQDDTFIQSVLSEQEERRLKFGIETDFLRDEIGEIRKSGFALNEGRLIAGMSGVAAPIRKSDGTAVAAISVAAITKRLSGARLKATIDALLSEAARIERVAGAVLDAPFAKRFTARPSAQVEREA